MTNFHLQLMILLRTSARQTTHCSCLVLELYSFDEFARTTFLNLAKKMEIIKLNK